MRKFIKRHLSRRTPAAKLARKYGADERQSSAMQQLDLR